VIPPADGLLSHADRENQVAVVMRFDHPANGVASIGPSSVACSLALRRAGT